MTFFRRPPEPFDRFDIILLAGLTPDVDDSEFILCIRNTLFRRRPKETRCFLHVLRESYTLLFHQSDDVLRRRILSLRRTAQQQRQSRKVICP